MKKLLIRSAIALVVFLAVIVTLLMFFINSIAKKGIETVGPGITKVTVKLDGVGLSPLSGKGSIKGLVVGNPEGFKTDSAIKVGQAQMHLKPTSLFSEKIVVRSINIDNPEITLEGSGLKNNNLNKILENIDASLGSGGTESKTKIQIDELNITGGKIKISLSLMNGKGLTAPLPPIQIKELGTGAEGITPAEAMKKIITAVLTGTVKAAESAIAGLGKDALDTAKKVGEGATDAAKKVTENAADAANKATKSIGNLFKK